MRVQLCITSTGGAGVFASDGLFLKNDRTFLTFLALQKTAGHIYNGTYKEILKSYKFHKIPAGNYLKAEFAPPPAASSIKLDMGKIFVP